MTTEFHKYRVTKPNGDVWTVGAPTPEEAALTFESNYLPWCPKIGECKVELIED